MNEADWKKVRLNIQASLWYKRIRYLWIWIFKGSKPWGGPLVVALWTRVWRPTCVLKTTTSSSHLKIRSCGSEGWRGCIQHPKPPNSQKGLWTWLEHNSSWFHKTWGSWNPGIPTVVDLVASCVPRTDSLWIMVANLYCLKYIDAYAIPRLDNSWSQFGHLK